jgi:hypothetical protein
MKTLINALLIGSLMTTVAFAGDPAPKADKTAPAKTGDKDKAAPATDAKKTDDKAAPAKDAKATDKATPAKDTKATDKAPVKKTDAKKDVKEPATK